MFSIGDNSYGVGSFLSAKELAVAEQAGIFTPFCAQGLWHDLAEGATDHVAVWGDASKLPPPFAPKSDSTPELPGKDVLRQVRKMRKCFVPPSKAWAPGISALSPCSLHALPKHAQAPASEEESRCPWHACAALRLGAFRGSSLAVGIRLVCRAGCMHEGCCIGLEAVGCCDGWGCFMSFTFAPASGRCFQEFGDGVPALCADALPRLQGSAGGEEDEQDQIVEVWVKVTPEGDMLFLRQVEGGPLEATGVLPHSALPDFAQEYHATVHFYHEDLEAPVTASVVHSGPELPPALQAHGESMAEFSAVWYQEEVVAVEELHHHHDGEPAAAQEVVEVRRWRAEA